MSFTHNSEILTVAVASVAWMVATLLVNTAKLAHRTLSCQLLLAMNKRWTCWCLTKFCSCTANRKTSWKASSYKVESFLQKRCVSSSFALRATAISFSLRVLDFNLSLLCWCLVDLTWLTTTFFLRASSSWHALQKSLPADSTSSSPGNSLALCLGVIDVGSAFLDPVDFFFPTGGVLAWTLLFLANAEGVGGLHLSRILGLALAALVEHPVESLLSNIVSDEDGISDGSTSESDRSFILCSRVRI